MAQDKCITTWVKSVFSLGSPISYLASHEIDADKRKFLSSFLCFSQKCVRRPDDTSGGGDGYDTDMDDKMGLARSPSRHPLQDTGLDIQATQAGVSCLPCPLPALPSACPVPPMLGP